ncbi:hypothetical protein HGB07_02190 [Candidatus Roizmanbacteria bacterium]|nr:hypothetical protein [Candidatus Roizmanbacteria bacterium]
MEPEYKTQTARLLPLILLVAFVLSGVSVLGYYLTRPKQPAAFNANTNDKNQPTPVSKDIWMTIEPSIKTTTYSVSSPLVLDISAQAKGVEIGGYDVLLAFDTKNFVVKEAKSLVSEFQVYSFPHEGYYSFTAARNLTSGGIIFDGNPVLRVTLQPKKSGNYTFKLLPAVKKEKTKFTDRTAHIIVPNLSELQVAIY